VLITALHEDEEGTDDKMGLSGRILEVWPHLPTLPTF